MWKSRRCRCFKTTGKVILQKDGALFLKIPTQRKEASITRLYQRRKGHTNPRFRKETKAPISSQRRPYYVPWKPQENRWTMKIYAN
jgi:hypothetical protein